MYKKVSLESAAAIKINDGSVVGSLSSNEIAEG